MSEEVKNVGYRVVGMKQESSVKRHLPSDVQFNEKKPAEYAGFKK